MHNLIEKLDQMKHKTFMYHTVNYKILNYECQNGSIFIATDKKIFNFNLVDFEKNILKEFLPVYEDELPGQALQLAPKGKEMLDLKMVIMENIRKVKDDKKYIPQAQSINKSVNTLINLVNTEIRINKGFNK